MIYPVIMTESYSEERDIIRYLLMMNLDQSFDGAGDNLIEQVCEKSYDLCTQYFRDLDHYCGTGHLDGFGTSDYAFQKALKNHIVIAALYSTKLLLLEDEKTNLYQISNRYGFLGYNEAEKKQNSELMYIPPNDNDPDKVVDPLAQNALGGRVRRMLNNPFWYAVLNGIEVDQTNSKRAFSIPQSSRDIYARLIAYGLSWQPNPRKKYSENRKDPVFTMGLAEKTKDRYVSFIRNIQKDISSIYTNPPIKNSVDRLLNDYQMERLFNFEFLKKAVYLCDSIPQNSPLRGNMFNTILLDAALLPNVFSRNRILKIMFDAGKSLGVPCYEEFSTRAFITHSETDGSIIDQVNRWQANIENYVITLSRFLIPLLEKVSFILLYQHFNRFNKKNESVGQTGFDKNALDEMFKCLNSYAETNINMLRHDFCDKNFMIPRNIENLESEKFQPTDFSDQRYDIAIPENEYNFFLTMYNSMFPYQRLTFEQSPQLCEEERSRFLERYYVRFDMDIFGVYESSKNYYNKERKKTIVRTLREGILESMKKMVHPYDEKVNHKT